MARKISDNATFNCNRIFRIKSVNGYIEFVECSSLDDLHKYIAFEWLFSEYTKLLQSIVEIRPDRTTPKIKRLSIGKYKKIYDLENHKKDVERAIREVESYMEVDYGES